MTSMAPTFSSRFSVNGAVSGITPTQPIPESRPSTRGGESLCSKTDSAKSRQHLPLPQVLESDDTTEEKQNLDSDVEKEEVDDDGHRPLHALLKRSTLMKNRTMSMDYEASVYTQNSSRLSDGPRPVPLNLTRLPSNLRHCYTLLGGLVCRLPLWEVGSCTLLRRNCRRWRIHLYPTMFRSRRCEKTVDDGHGLPSPLPSPITPNFASAVCMKIEDGKNEKGGVVSEDEGKNLDTTQESSGLGNRIIVEDEDEFSSRILNSSFNDKLFRLQGTRQRLLICRRLRFRCTCVMSIQIFCHRLNLSSNIGWLCLS